MIVDPQFLLLTVAVNAAFNGAFVDVVAAPPYPGASAISQLDHKA